MWSKYVCKSIKIANNLFVLLFIRNFVAVSCVCAREYARTQRK